MFVPGDTGPFGEWESDIPQRLMVSSATIDVLGVAKRATDSCASAHFGQETHWSPFDIRLAVHGIIGLDGGR